MAEPGGGGEQSSAAEPPTPSGWEPRAYGAFRRFLVAVAAAGGGSRLVEEPGVAASVCPAAPDRSLFNSVAYEDPADLERALDGLASGYAQAGVRAWTVWVPESDSASAELLEARGHRLDGSPRSMLLDLAGVPESVAEIEFTRAAEWEALCAVNDAAYGHERGTFGRGVGGRPDRAFRAYGARHQGWLASVLATILHEGDCGVYLVATLPEARRRGLAANLLHRALLDARERGCVTSTLQASPMGAPLYERIGYRDLGALRMYEHRVFPA